ncbi:hypothetical protein J437_LFUL004577 [Ladona fulva]|uniref:Uncharacterized protein n=1 Tax=Ladona fulva TaxID=123851 RepID=A0A8K0JTS8_LADFU|nr:hypothetical protein J437_LFUL004577 [Ladona fulva]
MYISIFSVGIYYLRAVAMARVQMVKKLREMLVMEAKDKEYLLGNIFKVTEGRFGPGSEFTGERYSRKGFNHSKDCLIGESSGFNHMEDIMNVTQESNLEDPVTENEWASLEGHDSREHRGFAQHKR